MALQTRNSGLHNAVLGQRIRHPSSTNFDDDLLINAAYRLYRMYCDDYGSVALDSDDESKHVLEEPVKVIPDSEADTDEENDRSEIPRETDLDTGLPPIK